MGTLKDLSIQKMVQLTEPWLDPKRDRPKLEALPSGKALLPNIEAAFQGLLSTQKQDATIATEVAKIQNEQSRVDLVHDRKLRGTYYVLSGLAELADDEEQEAALLAHAMSSPRTASAPPSEPMPKRRAMSRSRRLDGADEATARAVLGPVREAEKSAGKRGRKGDEPETPDSPSAPPEEKDA